jgi:hypothetical protein
MEISEIIAKQQSERDELGRLLMQALRDNMPWGLKIDLGNGRSAELVPMNGVATASQPYQAEDSWKFSFDWRLTNCGQDHIEVTSKVTGGGGLIASGPKQSHH